MFSPGPDVHKIHGPRRHTSQTLLTDGAVFGKKTTNFLKLACIIDQKIGIGDGAVNW